MTNILVVIDKTRRKIYMSKERYKHIMGHNEMQNKLLDIQEALHKPDIIQSKEDENVRDYYKYNREIRKYLFVSVKYLNGKGFIITSYYKSKIKK